MASEQLLIDMGFSKEQVTKAMKLCADSTEQAMEWLLAQADDGSVAAAVNSDAVVEQPTRLTSDVTKPDALPMETDSGETAQLTEEGSSKVSTPMDTDSTKDEAAVMSENMAKDDEEAKSIRCDECQKLFNSNEEVEFHAVKSGHSSFSETTDEKKALTSDEKKEMLKSLEEKMKQRRVEKEEDDRKENIDKEKKRIQQGKNMTEIKQKMAEKEMKLLIEERRREKLEDKMARQKVKDQIERDKIARRAMFGGLPDKPAPIVPVSNVPVVVAPKKTYDTARLQIRLPTGSPIIQEFKAKEPLSVVRLWIKLNRKDIEDSQRSFTLATTFPRKIFSEEDMDKPLEVLGLTPSSVLVVNDERI